MLSPTQCRPDFKEMAFVFKDLKRMQNCDHYLQKLLMTTEGGNPIVPKSLVPQYQSGLFKSVDHFVGFKLQQRKNEVRE